MSVELIFGHRFRSNYLGYTIFYDISIPLKESFESLQRIIDLELVGFI